MRHRAYVHGLGQIPVARARGGDKTAPRTSEETTPLRHALGAPQRLASQTRPGISAEVSMLQGAFQPPVVGDLLKVNKLIRRAKATDHVSVRFRSAVGARGSMLMVFSDAPLQDTPLGSGDLAKVGSRGGHKLVEVEGAQLSGGLRCNVLARPSRKIRRVCRSSFAAETLEAFASADHAFVARKL